MVCSGYAGRTANIAGTMLVVSLYAIRQGRDNSMVWPVC